MPAAQTPAETRIINRFMDFSSPPMPEEASVTRVMTRVLLALVPAIAVYVSVIGPAILVQLGVASAVALAGEPSSCCGYGKPLAPFLTDGSAVVTAWLVALVFPPLAPLVAGRGRCASPSSSPSTSMAASGRILQPAMVAFAVCIVSFPRLMFKWPNQGLQLGFAEQAESSSVSPSGERPHGRNAAGRPEDRAQAGASETMSMSPPLLADQTVSTATSRVAAGSGSPRLPRRRPVVVGSSASSPGRSAGFHRRPGGDFRRTLALYHPTQFASPSFTCFRAAPYRCLLHCDRSGGQRHDARGKLVFGAGAGLLALIRVFGGYPDGVAFAGAR